MAWTRCSTPSRLWLVEHRARVLATAERLPDGFPRVEAWSTQAHSLERDQAGDQHVSDDGSPRYNLLPPERLVRPTTSSGAFSLNGIELVHHPRWNMALEQGADPLTLWL